MKTLAIEQDRWKFARLALTSATAIAALIVAGNVRAQDNMHRLENTQTTGTGMEAFDDAPQSGDFADHLRKNLESIELPDRFKINLYAMSDGDIDNVAAWYASIKVTTEMPQ